MERVRSVEVGAHFVLSPSVIFMVIKYAVGLGASLWTEQWEVGTGARRLGTLGTTCLLSLLAGSDTRCAICPPLKRSADKVDGMLGDVLLLVLYRWIMVHVVVIHLHCEQWWFIGPESSTLSTAQHGSQLLCFFYVRD